MNALKKLGAGWVQENETNYRYDCSPTVFLRVIKDYKGWVLARFENSSATNAMFFPSLKQVVEHLNAE